MKNDLNYDLEIKISECEMLNKTLVEMFNKNVSQAQIDLVNDELINKLKEISHIKGKINSLKDIEKEAEEQHCSTDDNKKYYIPQINDEMLYTNCFSVLLTQGLKIPADMIKKVMFNSCCNKQIQITIYDFLATFECFDGVVDKIPIMSVLDSARITSNKFNFSIIHFDLFGKEKYSEKFINGKITDITRNELNYSSSEPITIDIVISYEDVFYETPSE